MHESAYKTAKKFFETYCVFGALTVVEIGARNLNGSLRDHKTSNVTNYLGLDFIPGNGVDYVLSDPYKYPFADNSVDVVVTSSCFEHAELFWVSFLEALRILRPSGLLYINAPSSWMAYHREPVDCWRFYPDAAKALETWAAYNKYNTMALETFIHPPLPPQDMSDWVAVFLKDRDQQYMHKSRMLDSMTPYDDFFNGFRFPVTEKFPGNWNDLPAAFYHQAVLKRETVLYYRNDLKY